MKPFANVTACLIVCLNIGAADANGTLSGKSYDQTNGEPRFPASMTYDQKRSPVTEIEDKSQPTFPTSMQYEQKRPRSTQGRIHVRPAVKPPTPAIKNIT